MLWLWDTVSREYTSFPTHKHPELTVATLTPSVTAKCLSHTNTHAKDMNVETPPAYYCASKNNHSLRITGRELKGGIRICEHDCKETKEVPLSGPTQEKYIYWIYIYKKFKPTEWGKNHYLKNLILYNAADNVFYFIIYVFVCFVSTAYYKYVFWIINVMFSWTLKYLTT